MSGRGGEREGSRPWHAPPLTPPPVPPGIPGPPRGVDRWREGSLLWFGLPFSWLVTGWVLSEWWSWHAGATVVGALLLELALPRWAPRWARRPWWRLQLGTLRGAERRLTMPDGGAYRAAPTPDLPRLRGTLRLPGRVAGLAVRLHPPGDFATAAGPWGSLWVHLRVVGERCEYVGVARARPGWLLVAPPLVVLVEMLRGRVGLDGLGFTVAFSLLTHLATQYVVLRRWGPSLGMQFAAVADALEAHLGGGFTAEPTEKYVAGHHRSEP